MATCITTVQQEQLIGGGVGIVQIGTVTTPPIIGLNLQDLGSIEGAIQETIIRDVLQVWDKQPQVLIDQKVIKEICKVSFTLKELWVRDIVKFLGYSPDASVPPGKVYAQASESESITDEIKTFWGNNPLYLYGTNLYGTPAVRSAAAGGGILYTAEIDYHINSVEGTLQRLSGSAIVIGSLIYITYTYTRSNRRYFNVGGSANNNTTYYFLKVIYKLPSSKRFISDYYRVSFDGPLGFIQNKGLNTYTINLIALADTARTVGDYYCTRYYEY